VQATLLIIPAQVQAASAAGGESLVVGTVAAPVSLQLLSLAPSTVWTLTALNGTDLFPVAIDGQLLSVGAAPLSDALDSVGAQQVKYHHPGDDDSGTVIVRSVRCIWCRGLGDSSTRPPMSVCIGLRDWTCP